MLKIKKLLPRGKRRWAAGLMACLIAVSALFLLLPPHASAALQTKVDSFATPSATGNYSVSGLGFTPKVVLFWANMRSSDGATGNDGNLMPMMVLGMAVSSTQRAVLTDDDNFTAGNPYFDGTRCITLDANGAAKVRADFVSMDPGSGGGFTVNFSNTVNSGGGNGGTIINYMALGGSDLTNEQIVPVTPAAGNVPISTVGFQPDALILIGGTATGAASSGGLGFVTSTSARGSYSTGYNGGIGRYQRNDKAYVQVSGSTKVEEADLVSFDASGFTLNFSTATSGTTIYALCLKGARFKTGSYAQPAVTGTGNPVSVLGFTPSALLLASALKTSSTTIDASRLAMMVGGSDGTNSSSVMIGDNTGLTSGLDRTKMYQSYPDTFTTSPAVEAAASLSSFDSLNSGEFVPNYTTADGTAREVLYFAIGSSGNSSPAAPTLIAPASGETGISALPTFQLRTTDADNDYLRYGIKVYTTQTECNADSATNLVRSIDETSSQTGWADQDTQSGTAYISNSLVAGSTIALHYYQNPALLPNTIYWWKGQAIDPGGTNIWGAWVTCQSFSTATTETRIQGNVNIKGGVRFGN